MAQILDRIWNIIKSNFIGEKEQNQVIDFFPDDEDLKKEIENAFNERNKSRSSPEGKSENVTLEWAYKTLGISQKASIEEIKAAYKRKVKEYHPDLVQNMGEEIQKLAKQKIQEINYAFELIKKSKGF